MAQEEQKSLDDGSMAPVKLTEDNLENIFQGMTCSHRNPHLFFQMVS